MKVASLILDFELYPRNNIDSGNVTSLCDAIAAEIALPPVIVEKRTKKVVDGFHRVKAYLRMLDDDAECFVVEKNYASDKELFKDAMRCNARHGARLDPCDRAHCVIVGERLQITREEMAEALSIKVDKLASIRETRTAYSSSGHPLPIKNTIRQFHGKRLTRQQERVNEKLSGMRPSFYANQLIMLIEADLLDVDDEHLMATLRKLHGLLEEELAAV
jgi:hypothetical protein